MGLGIRKIVKNNTWKIFPQLDKSYLRKRAVNMPLNEKYPFEPEAKLIGNITFKSKTVFDIGANTGFYSVILEDLVGQENLYLFEPLPRLYQLLKRRFPQANIINYAVSSVQETQYIQIPIINGKIFETRATLEADLQQIGQTNCTNVLVDKISLDEFVSCHQISSIGLIKIDVEGHELEVIKGAKDSIARFSPLLLIEIEQRHHKRPITEIFTLLESLGFSGYFLNPTELKFLSINEFDIDKYQNPQYFNAKTRMKYINNFFFVDRSSENKFVTEVTTAINKAKQPANYSGLHN